MTRFELLSADGRLFGRMNLVDAAVLLFVCWLVPLAYGGYLLFRPAPATISAVEPGTVPEGTRQVNIRGESLRPYLRMFITRARESLGGEDQAQRTLADAINNPLPGEAAATFLFAGTNGGVLQLPLLPAGSYDVLLLDEEQEISRLPGGLVVEASNAALVAIGAFTGLDAAAAEALASSLQTAEGKLTSWGEILGTQPPEPNFAYLAASVAVADGRYQIPAVLRFSCVVTVLVGSPSTCRVGNTPLEPGAIVPVALEQETVSFRISEVHALATAFVDITVRLDLTSEELAVLRTSEGDRFPARDAVRPTLVSATRIGETPNHQLIVNVRLRVPAVSTPDGWVNEGRVLRVGINFVTDMGMQQLSGTIIAVGSEEGR